LCLACVILPYPFSSSRAFYSSTKIFSRSGLMTLLKSVYTPRICQILKHADEDMTPSDMTIDYKVRSFLYLHSDFWYNSLAFTCTCHYLLVGTNVSQSASSSKLNFQFIGGPTMLHWEGHNSSIRSAIAVNEHLMESLFDNLLNRSGPISISHRQSHQIIKTCYRCFYRELHRHHGLIFHPWDPGPS